MSHAMKFCICFVIHSSGFDRKQQFIKKLLEVRYYSAIASYMRLVRPELSYDLGKSFEASIRV